MADPGGRTIGRVSLRVLPDTSKLREDLSKVLRRIEATMKVTIPADLDTTGFLTKIRSTVNEANSIFKVTAEVHLDENGLKDKVDRAARHASGADVTVNTDLDLGLARARLAAFTARPRFVDIIARANEGSLAKVATALAGLSGARSAGNIIERIGRSLGNLDKSLPSIAGLVLALGTLTSAALSTTAGLFAVGASLASIAATAIALPGVLAGFAVGTTVLVLALLDIKTQLGSLAPAFKNLQSVVSSTFWEGARQPILDLVNSVLPSLQTGMQGTAKALGGLFANLSSSLQAALGPAVLAGMFASLNSSIDIAAKAMAPLAQLIATLGTIGAAYLPGLAQNFTDITTKLNAVTQAAAADGRLKGWLDGGIAASADLFSALGAIGRILFGINEAAQAAGAGGLDALSKNLHAIADVINGPAFQGALTTLFIGAGAAMDGVAAALGPLGNLFVALAPTLASALTVIGATVGSLLGSIATALSDPAIAQGISLFVSGLAGGIGSLMPALGPIAQALGAVMGVAGALASVLGGVLGAAFSALAPVLTLLAGTLQPLITLLGGALIEIIGQVAPLLMQLATAVFPILASVIAALVPALVTVVSAILPVIAQLIPPVAEVLGLVAGAVVALLPVVAGLVAQLVGSLAPVLLTLVTALLPVLAEVFAAVIPVLVALLPAVGELIAVFVTALMPTIEALLPLVATVFAALLPIITAAVGIITGIVNVFAGVISGDWSKLWTGIKQIVSGAFDLIIAVIAGALVLAFAVILTALNLILQTFQQVWHSVAGLVSSAWEALKRTVSSGIEALLGFIIPGLARAIYVFTTFGPAILNVLGNLGQLLVNSGRAIVDGLIEGIKSRVSAVVDAVKSVVNAARDYFPFSPAKKGPFSGRGYTTYSGKALVDGLIEGVTSRRGALEAAASSLMSSAQPLLGSVNALGGQISANVESSGAPVYVQNPFTGEYLLAQTAAVADGQIASATGARLIASRMGAPA